MIFQRATSDRQDLSMIYQWLSNDLHGRNGLLKALSQPKTISQWSPREAHLSTIAQGALNDLIDLQMISQWSPNDL